jgi:glycosyltransferase involved in cell wall biosynthesis
MADIAPVTVLMATFNRAGYIRESLESILSQSRPPAQVVVIDDGSTDDTREVLRPYLSRIEYVHKENGGKSSALNLGLPRVTAEYVWVFDDDDVALPHALESHLSTFSRHPGIDFTYSAWFEGRGRPNGRIEIGEPVHLPDIPEDRLFTALLDRCVLLQQGMLTRAVCYAAAGLYNESLVRSQDYDMILRLAHRFRGARNPDLTFVLRTHPGPRGTALRRVDHAKRLDAWNEFDRGIGENYRALLPLHEYLGKQRGAHPTLTPAEARAARFTRASIMARKGLWWSALEDLAVVVKDLGVEEPLTREERHSLSEKTLRKIYPPAFAPILVDQSLASALAQILRSSPLGWQMRREMARGLRRELHLALKRRDVRLVLSLCRLALRLLGPRGILGLLWDRHDRRASSHTTAPTR